MPNACSPIEPICVCVLCLFASAAPNRWTGLKAARKTLSVAIRAKRDCVLKEVQHYMGKLIMYKLHIGVNL